MYYFVAISSGHAKLEKKLDSINSPWKWPVGPFKWVWSSKSYKGCLPKKKSIWRENVPTRGEGVPKKIKNSLLKIHFYLELFQGGEGVKSLFHISFQNIFLVKMALNVWKWWIISPLDPRCDLSTSWEQFWIVLNQNY